jgi:hypothetical protein
MLIAPSLIDAPISAWTLEFQGLSSALALVDALWQMAVNVNIKKRSLAQTIHHPSKSIS